VPDILKLHRKIVLKSLHSAENKPVRVDTLKEQSGLTDEAFSAATEALVANGLLGYLPGYGGKYKIAKDKDHDKELVEAEATTLEGLHRDILLACVPEDGTSKGNISLQQEAGLAEQAYWVAHDSLIGDGALKAGKGKGGSVWRVVEAPSDLPQGKTTTSKPPSTDPDDSQTEEGDVGKGTKSEGGLEHPGVEVIRPKINYSHVLAELSVNSKYPCEVIRELISNSYDARATEIRYYPLLQSELDGFLFFDNGTGMSHTQKVNGTSPYESFFSIGYSTKTLGEGIGYKCQGAKLAFACRKLVLITRCDGEERWRYKVIHNPREQLTKDTDIAPTYEMEPWTKLREDISRKPNKNTQRILHTLDQDFFESRFTSGTMIVILGFEGSGSGRGNFSRYFGTKNDLAEVRLPKELPNYELSYLWNYIRFYTRHGDIRILNADKTGFSNSHRDIVEEPVVKETPPPQFYIWVDENVDVDKEGFTNQFKEIPCGFPYLEKPKGIPLGPKDVQQMASARFYARHAGTFEYNDQIYTWILAIDGNRKALEEYITLNRQGKSPRSGLPLTEQRGIFLCSQGIKICQFPTLFESDDKYDLLSQSKAAAHFLFLLDGPFELVTDRNNVKASDVSTLIETAFLRHLKKALDGIYNGGEEKRDGIDHNAVFRSLIDKLRDDIVTGVFEKEKRKIDNTKKRLPERGCFTIKSGPLQGQSFVYPGDGEENWVGALYTLFAHLAPQAPKYVQSSWKDLWVRPVNMAGVSIDALAIPMGTEGLPMDKLMGLEYKLRFSHEDTFNHPLPAVHYIICWEFRKVPQEGTWVYDSFDFMGTIAFSDLHDSRISYDLVKIQQRDRANQKKGHVVKVISLKELIKETFECEMEPGE
jgi:hypothetical protein